MKTEDTPWTHNSHYYRQLLSAVHDKCELALDIGCGTGDFAAQLAAFSEHVEGLDLDAAAIRSARQRYSHINNLSFSEGNLDMCRLDNDRYNFISLIASLHHMEPRSSLLKVRNALKPGGVVVILGCYKEGSIVDYLFSLVAIPINLVYRFLIYRKRASIKQTVATQPARETYSIMRRLVAEILPDCKMQRRLL